MQVKSLEKEAKEHQSKKPSGKNAKHGFLEVSLCIYMYYHALSSSSIVPSACNHFRAWMQIMSACMYVCTTCTMYPHTTICIYAGMV